ncbi:MAG: hypothetical protein JSV88_19350 [Candidatus Aminicenantes bacterium]|nr:MAG: hypothetical protein JSV88_19350 [Candidatus Aminicenantes bacterium]
MDDEKKNFDRLNQEDSKEGKGGAIILKIFLFMLIFLVSIDWAHPTDNQFIKLNKVAVSSLPEDIIAPDLKSVTIDHKGNVFAFAGKSGGKDCFVVKFDENLKFLKRFGRDGKGPGEFSTRANSPENRLSIDTNGDLYVYDANPRRFVIFDNDGNYKKDIQIARLYSNSLGKITGVKVVRNGVFAALQYRDKLPFNGILFTLNPLKIIVTYPFVEKKIEVFYTQLSSDFYGDRCIVDNDSQHIIFGHSQIYKFKVYDKNGNLKLEVYDKKRVMGSFSESEMKKIINDEYTPKSSFSYLRNDFIYQLTKDRALFNKILAVIKRSKNVIVDIMISGERIYVFSVCKNITVENKYPVEIYNPKGHMVRHGYFSRIPAKIWGNYVFFYDRNKEDDPLILKYFRSI